MKHCALWHLFFAVFTTGGWLPESVKMVLVRTTAPTPANHLKSATPWSWLCLEKFALISSCCKLSQSLWKSVLWDTFAFQWHFSISQCCWVSVSFSVLRILHSGVCDSQSTTSASSLRSPLWPMGFCLTQCILWLLWIITPQSPKHPNSLRELGSYFTYLLWQFYGFPRFSALSKLLLSLKIWKCTTEFPLSSALSLAACRATRCRVPWCCCWARLSWLAGRRWQRCCCLPGSAPFPASPCWYSPTCLTTTTLALSGSSWAGSSCVSLALGHPLLFSRWWFCSWVCRSQPTWRWTCPGCTSSTAFSWLQPTGVGGTMWSWQRRGGAQTPLSAGNSALCPSTMKAQSQLISQAQ